MAVDVLMPKLSDTMEEGKILRWLKKPGDRVSRGDVLAEVETDKADMELEADAAGVLAKILVEEGGSVAVGQAIAVLGPEGSASAEPVSGENGAEAPAPAKPAAVRRGADDEADDAEPVPPAPRPAERRAPRPEPAEAKRPSSAKPTTPLRTVPPPIGRPAAAAAPRGDRGPSERPAASAMREELSKIRRTVARRMAESKRDAPHFYMTAEAEMGECARLKASLAAARPDVGVSYTHLLLRAVAIALATHRRINARYADGGDAVEFSAGINLGIAVALDDGLIVPVLHDCGAKDVFAIATEARALVERVRAGKPEGGDLSGGTFTVSNLGMYPIEEFAAVINPPQAAVLATGSVSERAVVRAGAVVARPTMRMTLSSDHRVIDGAEAAQFLATLKELLENPIRLVL